jgi:hypothetical protein
MMGYGNFGGRLAVCIVGGGMLAACGSGDDGATPATGDAGDEPLALVEASTAGLGTTGSATATAAARLSAHTLTTTRTIRGQLTIHPGDPVDARTISGVRISNSRGPCIVVRAGAADVVIARNQIGPCAGDAVRVDGAAGVRIEGNNIASADRNAIVAVDSSQLTIRNNWIDKASTGIRAVRTTPVEIDFNGGINIRGAFPDGQLVQFDNVRALPGHSNTVQCNAIDATVGAPDPNKTQATPRIRTEDLVSMWQSHGLPESPIVISWNRLKGGSSFTGSGIMVGDGDGSHIDVLDNHVVNPWNAGIGVAGGRNIRIQRNKVFSNMPNHVANEGFYIRDFDTATVCENIVHEGNAIVWPPEDWSRRGWTQTYWDAGECRNVTPLATSGNDLKASGAPHYLTAELFRREIPACADKAVRVGLDPTGW